jgi:hypothetical protein
MITLCGLSVLGGELFWLCDLMSGYLSVFKFLCGLCVLSGTLLFVSVCPVVNGFSLFIISNMEHACRSAG